MLLVGAINYVSLYLLVVQYDQDPSLVETRDVTVLTNWSLAIPIYRHLTYKLHLDLLTATYKSLIVSIALANAYGPSLTLYHDSLSLVGKCKAQSKTTVDH